MRATMLALLAATALVAPAMAQAPADPNVPARTAEDQNMRVIAYSPNIRVRIRGTIGRSLIISFAPGEEVKRVVFGDEGRAWEGVDVKEIEGSALNNQLPLFPKAVGYTTLQVITRRANGQDRAYQFAAEVAELPPCQGGGVVCDDPQATYGLRFVYPQDERETRETQARARAEENRQRWQEEAPVREQRRAVAQLAVARQQLVTDFFAGSECLNLKYEAEGNEAGRATLIPNRVGDNGQSTAFVYSGNRQIPAFFLLASDGKTEQPIMPTVRNGDTAELPMVAPEIRVRIGDAVLYVYNRAYSAEGCDPGTFTGRRNVVRNVRRAALPR